MCPLRTSKGTQGLRVQGRKGEGGGGEAGRTNVRCVPHDPLHDPLHDRLGEVPAGREGVRGGARKRRHEKARSLLSRCWVWGGAGHKCSPVSARPTACPLPNSTWVHSSSALSRNPNCLPDPQLPAGSPTACLIPNCSPNSTHAPPAAAASPLEPQIWAAQRPARGRRFCPWTPQGGDAPQLFTRRRCALPDLDGRGRPL